MDERTHGVMRALKDELDPTHTLNPGRLPGRL
jgi:FAD/FMN-containing dehydrogenase